MALRVAYPPVPPLPCEPTMSMYTEPQGAFPSMSGGFEPFLLPAKSEPLNPQDPGPPPTFLHSPPPPPPPPPPFSPLPPASFCQLKYGHDTELHPAQSPQSEDLSSWTLKHPDNWESKEVLDWVFSLADHAQGQEDLQGLDGALLRGEAYNRLTGRQLGDMSVGEFLALDRRYGARVHEAFHDLREDADFRQPLPPETFQSECFRGSFPHFDVMHAPDDVRPPQEPPPPPSARSMSVYADQAGREMMVSLDGLGRYDIDVDVTFGPVGKDTLRPIVEDSGYHSGSEGGREARSHSVSSDVFESFFSDQEEGEEEEEEEEEHQQQQQQGRPSNMAAVGAGSAGSRGRKPHTCSSSSCDSECEGGDEGTPSSSPRKRPSSSSKGNHLWEFIRDLLKDPLLNPSLVRWEDKAQGVFKFVRSEAVAQLWGRKKSNPQMTYEKLSRAMRFCRSAGYFESVPKTGRFPKKLCFKFGPKAHGWQD